MRREVVDGGIKLGLNAVPAPDIVRGISKSNSADLRRLRFSSDTLNTYVALTLGDISRK